MTGVLLLAALLADPDPHAILERVSAAAKNATTRQVTAQVSVDTKGSGLQQHIDMEMAMSAASGGRFRIDVKNGLSPMLLVSDGKMNWTYFPAIKKYAVSAGPLGDAAVANFGAISPGVSLTQHLASAHFIREESIDVAGEQVPCYVIQAEYEQTGSKASRELWIDKNRDFVIREESVTKGALETTVKMNVTSLKLNVFIPDSEFAFTPPEGASAISTPAPAPPGVYRMGPGVTTPTLLYKVEPRYSEDARQAKIEGAVVLYVVVGPDGAPRDMRVIRSLGHGLDENAIAAVAQWRFKPGQKDGKPAAIAATVEVNFRFLQKPTEAVH